jgi:transcription elongation factor GreA
MSTPVYISKEGLEKMKAELHELKTVKRPDVVLRIEKAKDLGDLKENAEYHDAKDEQGMIAARIAELEDMLVRTVVIEVKDTDRVTIGCSVHVKSGEKEKTFTIVGAPEADPLQGRISNESPLGMAFLGRVIGDQVEVKVPSGTITYVVTSITC